jgi:hypothetical protein
MRTGGGGQMRCKHLHAIEFAIRLGTLRDTDRLPTEAKVRKTIAVTPTIKPKSYTEDDYSFWFGVVKLMIIPTDNENKDQYKKLFTIQCTKEELDKITLDFVTQMNKYIARVNDRILKTLEEIENETEVVVEILLPPTSTSPTTSTRN